MSKHMPEPGSDEWATVVHAASDIALDVDRISIEHAYDAIYDSLPDEADRINNPHNACCNRAVCADLLDALEALAYSAEGTSEFCMQDYNDVLGKARAAIAKSTSHE